MSKSNHTESQIIEALKHSGIRVRRRFSGEPWLTVGSRQQP